MPKILYAYCVCSVEWFSLILEQTHTHTLNKIGKCIQHFNTEHLIDFFLIK